MPLVAICLRVLWGMRLFCGSALDYGQLQCFLVLLGNRIVVRQTSTMMCKLCGYDRPLVRSHPMPEFLYRAAYDEKHRAVAPDKESGREPFIRKGYREPLLCKECEQRFSRLE